MEENKKVLELMLAVMKETQIAFEEIKNTIPDEKVRRLEHSISLIDRNLNQIEKIISPESVGVATISKRL